MKIARFDHSRDLATEASAEGDTTRQVLVSEVGPRDGLQSISRTMPTVDKLRWITALHRAGLREIEVGSFVPPSLLPQMADVREVVAHALTLPGLTVAALAPNLRGAQAAFESGVHKLTIPISATEAHSLANVRKTHDQVFQDLAAIASLKQARIRTSKWRPGSRSRSAARSRARSATTKPCGSPSVPQKRAWM